ncbi:hypothetical protein [Asticcacaulis tiandongensis]|uniref:hypothetical protein n=1 Tax=Asticcacaulis tiandongensis TaxID=2565365 RepID=UPI001125B7CD|nr:hypothetical protein [Asticcacaulis tiandongensis]
MLPDAENKVDPTDLLAADFARLSQKPKKTEAGEGRGLEPTPRPSLRGSLTKTPAGDIEEAEISAIAEKVARGHSGFTSVNNKMPEKIEMERLTLAIPAVTGQDLAEKAAKSRVTKTFLLLKALKDAGFDVPEAALIPDGRARRI